MAKFWLSILTELCNRGPRDIAYERPEHRISIARAIVAGKLHNYRQLLLRSARDATGDRQIGLRTITERHATALADLSRATALPEVLGIEGHAARD